VMGLRGFTLVGQDVGGMVVYSGLRGAFDDLERAVIMDTVVPGVDPWEQVRRNPYIWHFAMHAIPGLPERLVQGRQREYFDYFYDVLSADPDKITAQARADYVQAYATDGALTAGFNWYRTFAKDAVENKEAAGRQVPGCWPGPRRPWPGAGGRALHAGGGTRRHLAADRRVRRTLTRPAVGAHAGKVVLQPKRRPPRRTLAR
jgi:pimeloyl-ACP methyl ester carboxylesterase